MSKQLEIIEKYLAENKKLGFGINEDLLVAVTKGLGPSIYNADASKVSGSDPDEMETVKQNYLIKKLGLADSAALDDAVKEVIGRFESSNPNKYRALVYAMLCEKFNKQSIYS